MPAYVAHRAQNLLNDDGKAIHGSSVLLLGVTYKPDIADQREPPRFRWRGSCPAWVQTSSTTTRVSTTGAQECP